MPVPTSTTINNLKGALFYLSLRGVFVNKKNEVLALRNARDGEAGKFYWDLPGGKVQIGESLADCLRREISEETGLKDFKVKRFLGAWVLKRQKTGVRNLLIMAYECVVSGKSTIELSSEHDTAVWVDATEVAKMPLDPGYRSVIEKALQKN